jgi:periplasmic protein TonB
MFADSFLETSGIQRSHRSLSTLTSFGLQAAIAAALLLFPLFHQEALPLLHRLSTPVSLGRPFEQPLAVRASGGLNSIFASNHADFRLRAPSRIPTSLPPETDDPGLPPGPGGPYIPGTQGDPNGQILNVLGGGTQPVMPVRAAAATPRIRISQMSPGSLTHSVQPIYPARARSARIQGTVVLAAIIGKDGTIANLHVANGHPMLTGAAIDAVRQWRYRPYILNGDPVEVETQITVNFSLSGS